MRRAGVLVLAIAMVLAGCPADGDGNSTGTVTPADVPEVRTVTPTATPTPLSSVDCDVPQPPAPSAEPPQPPSGPAPIPLEDGVVDAAALVEGHESALANHPYALGTPVRSVSVAENRSAFRATVLTNGVVTSHYAVDGTRYTYYFEDGGRERYGISRYEGARSLRVYGGSLSLTGGATIERVLSTFPHRVTEIRDDGWTVLRASIEEPTVVDDAVVEHLESRLLVDRRGIVRHVDTRLVVDGGGDSGDLALSGNTSLWVANVGEERFERPDWVCTAVDRVGTIDAGNGVDATATRNGTATDGEIATDNGTATDSGQPNDDGTATDEGTATDDRTASNGDSNDDLANRVDRMATLSAGRGPPA